MSSYGIGSIGYKAQREFRWQGCYSSYSRKCIYAVFVGLKEFSSVPIFDPSLFVEIRKRVGASTFDELNKSLIKSVSESKDRKQGQKKRDGDDLPPNKGKIQLDAAVADQYITHPTDSKILNQSRKQCEKMIDHLYELNNKKGIKQRK